jgi:segregation and condensation protein B
MSLKAKIEAVIYASEEPVTLAQLTGLLAEEAQAELDALADNQQSLDMDEAPDENEDSLNAEVLTPENAVILSEGSQSEPQSKDPEAVGATQTARELPATPAPSEAKLARLRERRLRDYFRSLVTQLIADYANADRGIEIREVAGGFRLATKPEYHDAVRGFVKHLKPPLKLSLQALETLAVVAYKQPVTAPEISEIRGVESAGTLGSLVARKLITTAGRKQVIGRPILYKTTKDFLVRFGLKDINELPSIEEFEKLAGELNETLLDQEPDEASETPEETPMPEDESIVATPAGTPTSIDELDAAPKPTHILHDTPEDLIADDSTKPEGHEHESEANAHSTQADGTPED